mmetsp:Transcript_51552/g.104942  ORF Transcript_51552/g.104942 Transcript_51552/m.104942 type:complete len:228 (+) Transcript_51552:1106-1789(+)
MPFSPIAAADPKSMRRRRPPVTIRLSGFTSRCATPANSRAKQHSNSCLATSLISRCRESPSKSSKSSMCRAVARGSRLPICSHWLRRVWRLSLPAYSQTSHRMPRRRTMPMYGAATCGHSCLTRSFMNASTWRYWNALLCMSSISRWRSRSNESIAATGISSSRSWWEGSSGSKLPSLALFATANVLPSYPSDTTAWNTSPYVPPPNIPLVYKTSRLSAGNWLCFSL